MNLVLGVALVLGLMIMIHEWGHFIAARWFGVRVDVFSIGFGPRLFGWKRGTTDYRISALPFGGYVRMAGQDPSDVDSAEKPPSGSPDELMSKPRWQRAVISFAGPAVNLIFPIILLTGLFVAVGIPYPAYSDLPAQVVFLPASSVAEGNPLQPGDKIVELNGVRNPTWEQAQKAIRQTPPGGTLQLRVENAGKERDVVVTLKDMTQGDRLLGYPPLRPVLDEVAPGTPAERAGLKEGDVLRAADGQKIDYWGQFVERVRGCNGKPVQLAIERHGQISHLVVTPQQGVTESGEKIYQVGVAVRDATKYRRAGLGEGMRDALAWTGDKIHETISVVGKLFTGRVSVKQLQGAVGISRTAGEAVRRGPLAVVLLMALISVNLGVMNLLPIPILDGGNILLLAIEGAMRRDLSLTFKERFVQVGFVFLLALFAYVMYNDVVRLLPIHS
ncbi:MAG TPA: RIP metalloprotease RseP [Candidatus Dormibacteraeota bacterium]|nr:RIP metalloprotease RseP [Candidatus Dormibacteraeota bacterium]